MVLKTHSVRSKFRKSPLGFPSVGFSCRERDDADRDYSGGEEVAVRERVVAAAATNRERSKIIVEVVIVFEIKVNALNRPVGGSPKSATRHYVTIHDVLIPWGVTVRRILCVIAVKNLNVGNTLIALTNLKITNVPEAKGILGMGAPERKLAMRSFFAPVTTETVELAAQPEEVVAPEEPVTPEEPPVEPTVQPSAEPSAEPSVEPSADPTPTPNSAVNTIFRLFSDFVNNLFRGFGRLFGH